MGWHDENKVWDSIGSEGAKGFQDLFESGDKVG